MSEGQFSPVNQVLNARSAIWLTCPHCDHTTRTLAVMAGRVLKERRQCPRCSSTHAPNMSQTVSGAHIPASEAHHAPANEEEQAYLLAWIKREDDKQQHQRWVESFIRWLAPRFSRSRLVHSPAQTVPAVNEQVPHLTPIEDDFL